MVTVQLKKGKFHEKKKWYLSNIFHRDQKNIHVKTDDTGSPRQRSGNFPRFQMERCIHFIYKKLSVWSNKKAVTQ